MEHDTDEKKIISKLFVSKESLAERLNSLVDLSKGIISIGTESGEIFIEDISKLSHSEKIFLNLLGSYFAYKSGLRENHHMTLGEIADKIKVIHKLFINLQGI